MSGIQYYIDDLNTRFTNLLFATQTGGVDDYSRNFSGLAVNMSGIPKVKTDGEYYDALLNDNYDISSFYIETGDRKMSPYSFEAAIDLVVMVKMSSFSEYEEEDIIEEVYEIAKVTPFYPFDGMSRDEAAFTGFEIPNKISDTMYPYFIFRFKSKLTGILKQKSNGI